MVKEIAKSLEKSIKSGGIGKRDDVHVLDLATGTADVAILLAKEYDAHFSKAGDQGAMM